jgi:hypothetical protein
MPPEVLPKLATFRRERIGCDIVNQLGQPIAVRPRNRKRWCIVNTGALTTSGPASFEQYRDVSNISSAAVPPLTLRGQFCDHVFEVTLHTPLQVPQFEIVQLILPWSEDVMDIETQAELERKKDKKNKTNKKSQRENITKPKISLLLRAVPDQGGHGCALLVTTTVVVRNNTSYGLQWGLPEFEPDRHRDLAALQLDTIGDSGEEAEDSVYPSEPTGFVGHAAHTGKSRKNATGRWLRIEATRKNGMHDQRPNSLGRLLLGPLTRRPLPLMWLAAASNSVSASKLDLGLEGSTLARTVLPFETISRLSCFDFSKSHREEEQQLDISGSLLRLRDFSGNDVHVCCSITVGLLADRAHCLEIVVSSVFFLVNHMPIPCTVQSYTDSKDFINVGLKERKVEAGSMVKEYVAADGIRLDFTTADGINWKANIKLKGSEYHTGDDEFATPAVEVLDLEESTKIGKLGTTRKNSGSLATTPSIEKKKNQMEISLSVICSSASTMTQYSCTTMPLTHGWRR